MLYQIKKGTVSLDGEIILDHIDFEIKGKEKIALVGENGAGKSTLLKLVGGVLSLDIDEKTPEASIKIARNVTIGMLPQNPWDDKTITLAQEVEKLCAYMEPYSKERFDFEQEYDRILTGMGFEKADKIRAVGTFSGGQQTKLAMIKLLLQKPDILLLDEPTNHLDTENVAWLEEYLIGYEGAVLYVSHDRYFLDRTADIIYEIRGKKAHRYVGNYTDYKQQKTTELKSAYKTWKSQQEEIDRLNAVIEKFKHKPRKASMARSKKKVLERMNVVEKPEMEGLTIFPEPIVPNKLGSKMVFDCKDLKIGYDKPIRQFSYTVRRGHKIGIIGKNGSGKSTWIKTLAEKIPTLGGKLTLGNGLEIAYFDQHTDDLPKDKRLIEYFSECFPDKTKKDSRELLARYQFGSEDLGKMIGDLSGGEKTRLALCILLERRPNVLLLDEITNHLDIPSIEVLEASLKAYQGTIILATHDRYFLKEIATSLLIFEENTTKAYAFDYTHYAAMQEKQRQNLERGLITIDDENAAILEQYEAVPTKKRMQAAKYNTEQSYTDWQLELAKEAMEKQNRILEKLCEELEEKYSSIEYWNKEKKILEEISILEQKQEEQIETCAEADAFWFEKYTDYEEAFVNYRD